MKIIVDAFGGDNAPLEVLRGCERAVRELGVEIILTGSQPKIKKCAEENGISLTGIEIEHTDDVFDIHDEPKEIIKSGSNTSMALGLKLLAEGRGEAFVSAGSTGALVMGATFIVKRIKGIKRIAPSPVMPADKGSFVLLDAGANTECRPEMLVQFAIMGSAYMERVLGIKNPKVGLLNIGAEETLYEGMGSFFARKLRWIFSGAGKLGAVFSLGKIRAFKKQMDYKEVGGSALLGVRKPVIKAHGSSDGTALFNAVRQAKKCAEVNVAGVIEEYAAATHKE